MGWSLVPAAAVMLLLALAIGCSHRPGLTAARTGVFEDIMARRKVFRGFQAEASLTLEHKADILTIPLEITVTEDLVLEARGEISHFLLPFEGEVRLVSTDATTLLHTNIGTYDLALDPEAQPSVRAFLLSLAGGGDWLLWWLGRNDCALTAESQCRGLEIHLEPHDLFPSVSRWELSEVSRGATFKAGVDEYEPGTTVPRAIKGVISPNEITVYMKYIEISVSPDPAG